jgi:class 3 adenylate cyclase
MAVVIFFGILYAISPKTFSRDMTFEPVPWFLGIWLVITLIRLYLAYRYRMSAPLLYLSIIFGAIGDESRMEYTVIGDTVNLAAKLVKHTKSEGVRAICTRKTFDIAVRQGFQPALNREQRNARSIEGVDNPVDITILAP